MNLTPQQQQKLSDMENGSHGQTKQLIGQIRKLRDKLAELYGSYSLDMGEAQRLNQQLNHVQGQLLDLRLSEQQQLRAILSPEQFAQLQAALRQQGGWGDHSHDRHGDDHGASGHLRADSQGRAPSH